MDEREPTLELRLTRDEHDLLRTALELLETTLSREEADELVAVQQLLVKLGPSHQ